MSGLLDSSSAQGSQSASNAVPIVISVMVVVLLVGVIAFFSRGAPKGPVAPHPYVANLKLSDLKMSTAENFVGASVTYIDGTVTNSGDKTVTHARVHVSFKNSLDQVAQAEDVALRLLQTTGPYPDVVDLASAPLSPGQSKPFRLIFEHVSADWNHAYPELQITDVTLK